jgi:hypothetical protein
MIQEIPSSSPTVLREAFREVSQLLTLIAASARTSSVRSARIEKPLAHASIKPI